MTVCAFVWQRISMAKRKGIKGETKTNTERKKNKVITGTEKSDLNIQIDAAKVFVFALFFLIYSNNTTLYSLILLETLSSNAVIFCI